jgi:hypothetical protein
VLEVAILDFVMIVVVQTCCCVLMKRMQHPKVAVQLMVKKKVAPGIVLQFVSNIKKFQREIGKS